MGKEDSDMDKTANQSLKEIRKFGLLFGVIFGLIGLWLLIKGQRTGMALLPLSVIFFFLALFTPALLRYPYKYWMALSNLLGRVMTSLILVLFYFLVVVPVGIVGRCLGKSFLPEGPDSSMHSYWQSRKGDDSGDTDLERQF